MRKHWKLLLPALLLLLLAAGFLIYASVYYHADETALAALESEGAVRVSRTDYGWFFDGPSERDALIFYPGAKVEAAAYAPLLRELAGSGMDVLLAEMPLRFAVFGMNKYEFVIEGGNHAQFGSYGPQSGDGEAQISPAEQWRQTVEAILAHTR